MNGEQLLSNLEGIRRTGKDQWIARCPAHDDKNPSLAIRETNDGTVLLKCFAGCRAHEIVSASGLELSDLFPNKAEYQSNGERRPFSAMTMLKCLKTEALIVLLATGQMIKGHGLTKMEIDRLTLAYSRISEAKDWRTS